MDADALRDLFGYFDYVDDPRSSNIRHHLSEMIFMTIVAVCCGAQEWTEIQMCCQAKHNWLKRFLRMPHGVPSHDTFGRVFAMIDPEQLERSFVDWAGELAERARYAAAQQQDPEQAAAMRVVAIDGKQLRRSYDRSDHRSAIHMVSAWCEQNQMVLGQLATEAKSNEITAVPKLLALLDIREATVTVDAMNCQKDIAAKIRQGGGQYVMQVKANQGRLYDQLKLSLDEAISLNFQDMQHDHAQTVDGDHGRIEVRRLWCTRDITWLPGADDWEGLVSAAVVECERRVNDKVSTERRYYLSSLPGDDAAEMLQAVRGHWGVENKLHWSLDVSFGEDASRIRKGHAAENLSRLRRIVLNLLKQDKTHKVGLKCKMKMCGWDNDYLIHILTLA